MMIRIAKESDLRVIIKIYNQAIDEEFCTADLEYLVAEDRPPVPTLDQLAASLDYLQEKAERLLGELAGSAPAGWSGAVVPGRSSVGGGSFSTASIESRLVQWKADKQQLETCHQRLRTGDPALVGRMNQDGLAVDVRTISEEEIPLVVAAFRAAWTDLPLAAGD